jgi:hypothetical protein
LFPTELFNNLIRNDPVNVSLLRPSCDTHDCTVNNETDNDERHATDTKPHPWIHYFTPNSTNLPKMKPVTSVATIVSQKSNRRIRTKVFTTRSFL